MENFKVRNNLSYKLGEYAIEAMLYEAAVYPSPGLVSPVCNGAHKDMNYYTFISSTATLSKHMVFFAESGFTYKGTKEIFSEIRLLGIEAEKDMFIKTKNINTHKGMIFLMGITLAATAKTLFENREFEYIQENIKSMTLGIVSKELKTIKKLYNKMHSISKVEILLNRKLTYGERLYIDYGIEGVRGEVERGLDVVFNGALRVYEENQHKEEYIRILRTLTYLMANCEDSTILHRHHIKVLREINLLGKKLFDIKCDKKFAKELEEVNKDFSSRGISPGGTADLLAITIYLNNVKKNCF
ncbi:MAG: triphosphoribosyl-dephospho-CoA synthase [Clostridium sp.]